jgi:hypothetical protein
MTVFAHLPIYGLEDLGLVPRGEAGRFIAERNIAPAASCRSTSTAAASPTCIPACTACTQESVRPAQIPDAKISVCHSVGGMFAASGTIIMSNEPP